MAVTNGAKSIGYFTHSWSPTYSQFRVSSAVQAEMARTDRQLTNFTPALLGSAGSVTKRELTSGRIDMISRTYNGATYIFAVNNGRTDEQVRFESPSLAGRSVQVFEENRSITADSTGFADAFAPLAVHVYVVPPPGL
jgi:hypothetical protein